jgi:hypothetical protein
MYEKQCSLLSSISKRSKLVSEKVRQQGTEIVDAFHGVLKNMVYHWYLFHPILSKMRVFLLKFSVKQSKNIDKICVLFC